MPRARRAPVNGVPGHGRACVPGGGQLARPAASARSRARHAPCVVDERERRSGTSRKAASSSRSRRRTAMSAPTTPTMRASPSSPRPRVHGHREGEDVVARAEVVDVGPGDMRVPGGRGDRGTTRARGSRAGTRCSRASTGRGGSARSVEPSTGFASSGPSHHAKCTSRPRTISPSAMNPGADEQRIGLGEAGQHELGDGAVEGGGPQVGRRRRGSARWARAMRRAGRRRRRTPRADRPRPTVSAA